MIIHHDNFSTTREEESSAIRLLETKLASQVEAKPNPFYRLNSEDLKKLVLLPVAEGFGETVVFYGTEYASRGREIGDSRHAVEIEDINGYKTIGIVTVKGVGLRDPLNEGDYTYGGSAGLLGIDETTIDAGMGNFLRECGADIGDSIGLLRLPTKEFLQFLEAHGATEYASVLRKNEFEQRDVVPAMVRLSDPERLGDVFESKQSMHTSAMWMAAELTSNGKASFIARYDVPEEYLTQLENLTTETFTDAAAQNHARLLTWLIARNYAICLKNKVSADFSERQIGNLGKLHDFAATLDQPEADGVNQSTTSTFTTLLAETVIAKGKFLDEDEITKILSKVEEIFELDLTSEKNIVEEKAGLFVKKYSDPPFLTF